MDALLDNLLAQMEPVYSCLKSVMGSCIAETFQTKWILTPMVNWTLHSQTNLISLTLCAVMAILLVGLNSAMDSGSVLMDLMSSIAQLKVNMI